MARYLSQAVMIKAQIEDEIGPNPSQYQIGQIQQKYGISRAPFPFDHLVDPFRQAFPCVSHCIDLGLMLRLFTFMLKSLDREKKIAFQVRAASVEVPRHWTRLPTFATKMKGRLSEPMTVVRKLSMFVHTLFSGLVNNRLLELALQLRSVRTLILHPHHTNETIESVSFIDILFLLLGISVWCCCSCWCLYCW